METVKNNHFYVYVWRRKGNVPCYVGKGHGDRWRRHKKNSTNPWLRRILAREITECTCEVIGGDLSELEALELERLLISEIGRRADGGTLVNITLGGDGVSGLSHSYELKAKTSARSKLMWADSEMRKLILDSQREGRRSPEFRRRRSEISRAMATQEWRSRLSAKMRQRFADPGNRLKTSEATKNAMRNPEIAEKTRLRLIEALSRPEVKEKMRLATLGRKHSEETKRKIAEGNRGKKYGPETRAKMSAWQIGRKMSDDAKRKMSVAAKARHARRKSSQDKQFQEVANG